MKLLSHKIKRTTSLVGCLCIFVLSFSACTLVEDKVVASMGKYENHKFFTSGGFQDYTDYGKYYYTSPKVEENKYLMKVQEADITEIVEYLDDFEGWIEAIKDNDPSSEVVVNYDFDREIIDIEDYYFIDSEEMIWDDGNISFVKYNIYLFDTQTQVLYYFHNNI